MCVCVRFRRRNEKLLKQRTLVNELKGSLFGAILCRWNALMRKEGERAHKKYAKL